MEFNNIGFTQPHTPNEVGSHNNVIEVLSPTKPSSPAAQIEVERKFQVLSDETWKMLLHVSYAW